MNFAQELKRKLVHFGTVIIPIGYYLTDYKTALWAIGGLLALAILTEYLRMYVQSFNAWFMRFFGTMLRSGETDHYSGATYLLIAAFLVILTFHRDVAILCLLFLTFGDGIAAIVGKRFGRFFFFGKTLEGMLAGMTANIALSFLFPHIPIAVRLTGAITAAVIEILPMRASDNLRIPIVSGSVMQLMWIGLRRDPVQPNGTDVIVEITSRLPGLFF